MTVNELANNDRTKWDYFFNMDVIEFLNSVAFLKDRNKTIEALRHGQ